MSAFAIEPPRLRAWPVGVDCPHGRKACRTEYALGRLWPWPGADWCYRCSDSPPVAFVQGRRGAWYHLHPEPLCARCRDALRQRHAPRDPTEWTEMLDDADGGAP